MESDLELQTMRKVAWRLVPLVGFAYLINVLDRFNIAFAALTMNKALACRPPPTASAPARSFGAMCCSRCRPTP